MWVAEFDTHGREFPTCVHVTKTTNTMTHGSTYVPIEEGKAVRNENAKLRNLLADVHEALCLDKAGVFHEPIIKSLERDMRELGIEVGE